MYLFYGLLFALLILHPAAGANNCPDDNEAPKIIPGVPPPVQSRFQSHYNELGWSQIGNQWSLDCKAPYPVEWTFEGNQATWTKTKSKLVTKTPQDNSTACYTVSLNAIVSVWPIFSNVNSYVVTGKTGNYTCRSIADKKKSTSVYKFVYDEKVGTIFNTKSKLNTTVRRNRDGDYIIPCPSNVENFHASLVKLDEKGLESNVSTSDDAIDYDPKVGFLMKKYISGTGYFKCHGRYKGKSEEVLIHFKEPPNFAVEPAEQYVSFQNSVLTLTCASNEQVTFDTTKLPADGVEHNQMGYVPRNNFTYVTKLVLKLTTNDTAGEVSCVTTSKNRNSRFLHTWKFDTAKSCNCGWDIVPRDWENYNRYMRYSYEDMRYLYFITVKSQYGRFHCNNSVGLETKTVFLPCKNPIECNIMSPALKGETFHHFEKGGTDDITGATTILSEMTSGFLRCSVDQYSTVQTVHAGLTAVYFDNVIPKEDQMRISSAEGRIFLGDTMLFACEAVGHLFTQELKWAFGYRNGSINFLESKPQNETMGQDKLKIYRASYLKIDDREMELLYCFAPSWNSSDWRNISMPLIIESYEPRQNTTDGMSNTKNSNIKSEIVMYRFGDTSSKKTRVPHIVTDTTVIIRDPIKYVKLDCASRFPVEWFFENELINSTFKFIKESTTKMTNLNYALSFQSTIQILTNATETTGNYSCRKKHHDKERVLSSVFVFSSGDGSMPIIGHGQHRNVAVKSFDEWVTLPCRVSHPDVHVHLYQQEDTGEYIQIDIGPPVRFDPKFGFLIKRSSSLLDKFPQFFACSTYVNDTGLGVSFSLLPVEWEEEAFYSQQGSNAGLYAVLIIFIIIIAALSLGVVHFWRKTRLQEQLIHSYTSSKIQSFSQDRQPVVLMDELSLGRDNLEFQNELHLHGRNYDHL